MASEATISGRYLGAPCREGVMFLWAVLLSALRLAVVMRIRMGGLKDEGVKSGGGRHWHGV